MNDPAEPKRAADDAVATASTVEGEIRDFARRDIKATRRRTAPAESTADHLNSLIERVAGMSMKEIDNLIAELQAVRNFVIAEGERVQREFTNYTQATQAARSSVKIITDAMGQWKNPAGAPRGQTSPADDLGARSDAVTSSSDAASQH
jgi:hypothetical protein